MSQGVALLDEALELARQEKAALESGAYESAIELAEKRGNLTNMAWNLYGADEKETYASKLSQLTTLHSQLTAIASRAHAAVRDKLNHSRMEKRRYRGYQMAVSQALN